MSSLLAFIGHPPPRSNGTICSAFTARALNTLKQPGLTLWFIVNIERTLGRPSGSTAVRFGLSVDGGGLRRARRSVRLGFGADKGGGTLERARRSVRLGFGADKGALERAGRPVRLSRSMDGLGLEGGAARPRLERDDAVGNGADRPRVALQADRPRVASSRRRQRWRLQADRPRWRSFGSKTAAVAGTRRKGSADSMLSSVELGGCSAELRRKREERVAARSAEESVERLGAESSRNSSARRYEEAARQCRRGQGLAEEASVGA
uniref:Uncharacterized protein n=1 Tax=Ananas comosus var. bracteatus TaxID=296719 RepID=A0A6V7PGQ1_ANACO|nr:unnamed protein product [Ananas comosus var. bracteatus]